MDIKNSQFLNTTRAIKAYECSMIAQDGVNIIGKLNLSDVNIPYENVYTTKVTLNANTSNVPLIYGFLGNNITFLFIKASYYYTRYPICQSGSTYDNSLQYYFKFNDGTLSDNFYMSQILALTGSDLNRIPQIYFNNLSNKPVILEIMCASLSIKDIPVIPSQTTVFTNLYYNSIISDVLFDGTESGSTELIVVDNNNNNICYIPYNEIKLISANQNTLNILTASDVTIQLNFLSVFNREQAHSRINWVLNGTRKSIAFYNRILTISSPNIDLVSPNIFYYSGFTGTGNTTMNFTGQTIMPSDIISYFVNTVIDYDMSGQTSGLTAHIRDGIINKYNINVTIKDINSVVPISAITYEGIFQITFDILDIAENETMNIFNLYIDKTPPVITFNSTYVSGFTMTLSDSAFTATDIINYSVYSVTDNLSTLSKSDINLIILDNSANTITEIFTPDIYYVTYSVSDLSGNITTISNVPLTVTGNTIIGTNDLTHDRIVTDSTWTGSFSGSTELIVLDINLLSSYTIALNNISLMTESGADLIISLYSGTTTIMNFLNIYEMKQAHSRISWLLNSNILGGYYVNILTANLPIADLISPKINLFNSGLTIDLMTLVTTIEKIDIVKNAVISVIDYDDSGYTNLRDGIIFTGTSSSLANNFVVLIRPVAQSYYLNNIVTTGNYEITYNITDIAGNLTHFIYLLNVS